jgi:hypothetical protein
MSNFVTAGEYQGRLLKRNLSGRQIWIAAKKEKVYINTDTVRAYETEDASSRKSGVSAVTRAAVGGALLGPLGLFAAVGAKSKKNVLIAIEFKDGKKSLLEVDGDFYKLILNALFGIKSEPSDSAQTSVSVADELSKLKSLMDDGVLTSAEFAVQKAKLLA